MTKLEDDPVVAARRAWATDDITFITDEPELTAAAEAHTGAMIALVPASPESLVLDNGEPEDELHLTLLYLGDAAMIPDELRERLVDIVSSEVKYMPTIIGNAFAVNYFNPNGDEPCTVLGLSGSQLESIHERIVNAIVVECARVGFQIPQNHVPWIPHVTLVYDQADLNSLKEKLGPIEFNAVRLAFGGDNYDVPLGENTEETDVAMTAAGWEGEPL